MVSKTIKLERGDVGLFIELIKVFEEVFEMPPFEIPSPNYLSNLLAKEDFLVFVALENHRVIGGLTAYILHQYYAKKPLTYLFDLAVSKDRQRAGIGKLLIRKINQYCQGQGHEEVFVQADQDEQYALDFYRSTKPTAEEKVIHFYYTLG